jgi:hypothetical protein
MVCIISVQFLVVRVQVMLIYRVRINYRRISLRHNLCRKCCKIVKFVSITHSERDICNGPIVATAISREKRKPELEGNGCLTFSTWPPRSPDLTVCDLFLRGFVKDSERFWRECEYLLDICRVTRGAHIEYI